MLMFVLLADSLSRMSERSKKTGLIQGLLGSPHTTFTNLQHAYDTLIFGKCRIGQACVIKGILVCFEV